MSLKLEDVIRTYVQLRDQKSDLEKALNEQLDPIKKQLEKLESYLLRELTEQGVSSFKTEGGTAFITTREWATGKDWEATLQYIRENDAYDLLERRVSKIAVRTLVDGGTPPPGVNYGTKLGVNIRRPNS